MPAFVVFSDATLLAIAERRPTDNAALLSIPGIGRAKLDAYGPGRHRDRQPNPLNAAPSGMPENLLKFLR